QQFCRRKSVQRKALTGARAQGGTEAQPRKSSRGPRHRGAAEEAEARDDGSGSTSRGTEAKPRLPRPPRHTWLHC
ncbi:hypothetical protein M885DRAFT_626715, partial [Pelagophyceae sp. CCMP2097]